MLCKSFIMSVRGLQNLVFLSSTRMNHHIAEAQGLATTHKFWLGFVTSLIFEKTMTRMPFPSRFWPAMLHSLLL